MSFEWTRRDESDPVLWYRGADYSARVQTSVREIDDTRIAWFVERAGRVFSYGRARDVDEAQALAEYTITRLRTIVDEEKITPEATHAWHLLQATHSVGEGFKSAGHVEAVRAAWHEKISKAKARKRGGSS